MHQSITYPEQFNRWIPNSTVLLEPPTDADRVARALVECLRRDDMDKYEFIANLLLDSIEVNAYLSVLSQCVNAKPAGE